MGFIKEWWHWLLLGLVIITLVVVRFFIISGKMSQADKEVKAVQSNVKEIKNLTKQINDKELPTSGDLKKAEALQSQIIAERDAIEKMWMDSSKGLELKHNQNTTDYVNFLYKNCEKMCWQLSGNISRLRGVSEDVISKVRQGRKLADIPQDIIDKMYWPCDHDEHHLVEYADAGSFRTVEETNTTWIQYLISRRIHEIVSTTSTEVDGWKVVEVKNADPIKEKIKQIRTIDRLGAIEFSDDGIEGRGGRGSASVRRVRSRMGGTGEEIPLPGNEYYTVYPVDINVVGHICTIQELMNNFLKSKDILFVLKKVSISRYEDKDTQFGATLDNFQPSRRTSTSSGMGTSPAMPSGTTNYNPGRAGGGYSGRPGLVDREEQKPWPSSLNLTLSADHEPPVQAILSYEIYRFGEFEKKNEAIEDGTGN